MYTLAFETDITSQIIVFKDYEQVLNKHAKVFVVIDDDEQTPAVDMNQSLSNPSSPLDSTMKHSDWLVSDFNAMSVEQAMRGLESEPDLYSVSDLKEIWR
jgi:hypothetical protein